ncbi:hypothetical protein ISS06_02615 [Patescibacteria group bacterium]|nr:hypothetical protein [Patescibacteria group bacterium]
MRARKNKQGKILKDNDNVLRQLAALTKEEQEKIRQEIKDHPSPFFEEFVNPLTLTSSVCKK